MSTTEGRVFTPEQPSRPRPSSKSPRADPGDTPNIWLIAANKITEKKKAPTEELLRRLSITKTKILNDHSDELQDVSEEAMTGLSKQEQKLRLKSNEKVVKRLRRELSLQAEIHKMSARLVVQYNITIDEALSLAETEIREEVELARQKKLNDKEKEKLTNATEQSSTPLPLSLDEEIDQYAHQLEDTEFMECDKALTLARQENNASNLHSTDQLFATLFKKEPEEEGGTGVQGLTHSETEDCTPRGDPLLLASSEPLDRTSLEETDGGKEEVTAAAAAPPCLREEDVVQEVSLEGAMQPVPSGQAQTPAQTQAQALRETSLAIEGETVEDSEGEGTPQTQAQVNRRGDQENEHATQSGPPLELESDNDDNSNVPKFQNRRFVNAVENVMAANKAKRQAFKSLGRVAMSKTVSVDGLSKTEDESDSRQKDESSNGNPPLQQESDKTKARSKLLGAVGKVMAVNAINRQAFKSLGKAVMSKTAPAGVLSLHSKAADDDEERRKEEGASLSDAPTRHDAEQKIPVARHEGNNFTNAVGKVISPENPFLVWSSPTTSASSTRGLDVQLMRANTTGMLPQHECD
jgi:hypothetical protein